MPNKATSWRRRTKTLGVVGLAAAMGVGCMNDEAASTQRKQEEAPVASAPEGGLEPRAPAMRGQGDAEDAQAESTYKPQANAPDLGQPEQVRPGAGRAHVAHGYGKGVGLGAAPPTRALPKPKLPLPTSGRDTSATATVASPPRPPVITETVLDPNGRYATTYRPGGGHLAAFESAVALGIVPAAEREVVSDIGARYAPEIAAPTTQALALQTDFERTKLGPEGGPVHVRLSLRSTATPATERPPLAVVVVLDTSGSMRGELIESARKAASQFVDKLDEKDQFSLVRFSTDAEVLVPMGVLGGNKESVKKTISEIADGGGTNIGEGLRLGYEQAEKSIVRKDAVRVVMLLSDGRATEGMTQRAGLSRLALGAFEHGVQTSAFGLGSDYDGPLMSQIANDGAGGYYYLPDASQIAPALATELEKRLDPVATAVELRVRLKPGVELLDVYGSRRLSAEEASRIRAIEVAQDAQTEARTKIKANRQDDREGGMRFFIPAFARDDSHSILLELRAPAGVAAKDLALVELKYKDLVGKKNAMEEVKLAIEYANSDAESAASIDPSVRRTVQGFAAGVALTQAAQLVADGRRKEAVELLGEREGLLLHAAAVLGEPLFVQDAKRLSRLRAHAAGTDKLGDPLVLAMMMETAGGSHLR